MLDIISFVLSTEIPVQEVYSCQVPPPQLAAYQGTFTTACQSALSWIGYVLQAVLVGVVTVSACTVLLHNLTSHNVEAVAALYVVSVAEIVLQSAAIAIFVQAINSSCLASNAFCKSVWLDNVPVMFHQAADVCVLEITPLVISIPVPAV